MAPSLIGCATPVPKAPDPPIVIIEPKDTPPFVPAGLLSCGDEPIVPADKNDVEARANYFADLGRWGRLCWSRLGGVRRLLERKANP